MEKSYTNNPKNKGSILKSIFNKDFIISAVVPVIIFYVFNKFKMPINGIILSGLWSIGVVVVNFIKERKLNALAVIAAAFSGIGLAGTIISKNPTFYFISPLVGNALFALMFFLSLLFSKSLIQVIVEQSYLKNAPEEIKNDKSHKLVWKFLTMIWGIGNLSQAVLGIVLLKAVSMSSYYAIITIYGNVLTPSLIIFSIGFSKWYLKKKKENF